MNLTLTLDATTALELARLHQADVRAAFPRGRRRRFWQRSHRPETSPTPPRTLRLPAAPTFQQPPARHTSVPT